MDVKIRPPIEVRLSLNAVEGRAQLNRCVIDITNEVNPLIVWLSLASMPFRQLQSYLDRFSAQL